MQEEKYAWDWKRFVNILVTAALIMIFFPYKTPVVISDYLMCYWIDFIYTFTIWEGCLFITLKIREKHAGLENTKIRLMLIYSIVLVYNTLMIVILQYVLSFMKSSCFSINDFWFSERVSLVVTLIVLSIYEATYFYGKWRDTSIEADKLKQENTQAQLEGLKNQVNPHFLFNSLNTLAAIIEENPPLAVNFVQKLAEVYRYVLNMKDKQTIPLHTELECVEAFIFLLKIRYEDHFEVKIKIGEDSQAKHIPPVALQMLVENAIKHNVISKTHPLHLSIYDDVLGNLVIENNFQPKEIPGDSTGIGLKNICSRYAYLTERKVIIEKLEGKFIVKLPLLEL